MEYLKKSTRSQQANQDRDETVRETVTEILADVRARGMAAVRDYSRRFDKFDPPSKAPALEQRGPSEPISRRVIPRE